MQIVIDIPGEWKTRIEYNRRPNTIECGELVESIWRGKILPKGHGRLIDADEVLKGIDELRQSPWFNEDTALAKRIRLDAMGTVRDLCVKDAPTIIETDKAESEEEE